MDDSIYQQLKDIAQCEGVTFTEPGRLGEGAYARVEACEYKGEKCAAKISLHSLDVIDNLRKEFERGPELWAIMNGHAGLTRHVDHFTAKVNGYRYLVTLWEQARCGLDTLIPIRRQEELKRYLEPTCDAIDYLNGQQIYHRDIKPENILVFADGSAKLGDLGNVRSLGGPSGSASIIGTPFYWPPEAFDFVGKNRLHHTADVYSLAVTYVVMNTGYFPYGFEYRQDPGFDDTLKFKRDAQHIRDSLLSLGYTDKEVTLFMSILEPLPDNRDDLAARDLLEQLGALAVERQE
ncbi:MAG: protein kinase [Planctomycetes bacterium]|nr:protein kinase [Planctomycetota bacterium]